MSKWSHVVALAAAFTVMLLGAAPSASADVANRAPISVNDPTPEPESDKGSPPEAPIGVDYQCYLHLTATCPLDPWGSTEITPPGGNRNKITASGSSDAYVTRFLSLPLGAPCKVDYKDNYASVAWWGSNPYNANKVTMTVEWDSDYVAGSISIGSPPSGSLNKGNGLLSWTDSTDNTWRMSLSDPSIYMTVCGSGRLTGVNYRVTGAFKFGSDTYRITGRDGAVPVG